MLLGTTAQKKYFPVLYSEIQKVTHWTTVRCLGPRLHLYVFYSTHFAPQWHFKSQGLGCPFKNSIDAFHFWCIMRKNKGTHGDGHPYIPRLTLKSSQNTHIWWDHRDRKTQQWQKDHCFILSKHGQADKHKHLWSHKICPSSLQVPRIVARLHGSVRDSALFSAPKWKASRWHSEHLSWCWQHPIWSKALLCWSSLRLFITSLNPQAVLLVRFMCQLGWARVPRYLVKHYCGCFCEIIFRWD